MSFVAIVARSSSRKGIYHPNQIMLIEAPVWVSRDKQKWVLSLVFFHIHHVHYIQSCDGQSKNIPTLPAHSHTSVMLSFHPTMVETWAPPSTYNFYTFEFFTLRSDWLPPSPPKCRDWSLSNQGELSISTTQASGGWYFLSEVMSCFLSHGPEHTATNRGALGLSVFHEKRRHSPIEPCMYLQGGVGFCLTMMKNILPLQE